MPDPTLRDLPILAELGDQLAGAYARQDRAVGAGDGGSPCPAPGR